MVAMPRALVVKDYTDITFPAGSHRFTYLFAATTWDLPRALEAATRWLPAVVVVNVGLWSLAGKAHRATVTRNGNALGPGIGPYNPAAFAAYLKAALAVTQPWKCVFWQSLYSLRCGGEWDRSFNTSAPPLMNRLVKSSLAGSSAHFMDVYSATADRKRCLYRDCAHPAVPCARRMWMEMLRMFGACSAAQSFVFIGDSNMRKLFTEASSSFCRRRSRHPEYKKPQERQAKPEVVVLVEVGDLARQFLF